MLGHERTKHRLKKASKATTVTSPLLIDEIAEQHEYNRKLNLGTALNPKTEADLQRDPEMVTALMNRPVFTLVVEAGPDRGKSVRFDQAEILLGRDDDADFQLSDRTVSTRHGLFLRDEDGFRFRDLNSTHGSKVLKDRHSTDWRTVDAGKDVALKGGGMLKVGQSLLRLEVDHVFQSDKETGPSRLRITPDDVDTFMAAQKPENALSRRIENKDSRLQLVFDMARKLNGISQLSEILEMVAATSFEAFPAADLFCLSLLKGTELRPMMVRLRDLSKETKAEVILSRSILARVVDTQEAVLFIRAEEQVLPSESILDAGIHACLCAPLVGQSRLLGVMQLDTRTSSGRFTREELDLFCVLASNTAFALERADLTQSIYRMFEGIVEASVHAIEARDPTTAGHSERVSRYSLLLAEELNRMDQGPYGNVRFTGEELTELRYAALLHDFGKVGVRESVLTKSSRLGEDRFQTVRQRFATIASLYENKLMRQLLQESKDGFDAEKLAALDQRCKAFHEKLFSELEIIETLSKKYILTESDLEHIKALSGRAFTAADGRRIPFLTEAELADMGIRVGTLNDGEWENMRSHVSQSETFLQRIPWSKELKNIPCLAGAHHEKLDGSGYPRGLTAPDIPTRVRILTIADIFDAVTAWDRPYCQAIDADAAVNLLTREAGNGRLDRDLVAIFNHKVLERARRIIPKR